MKLQRPLLGVGGFWSTPFIKDKDYYRCNASLWTHHLCLNWRNYECIDFLPWEILATGTLCILIKMLAKPSASRGEWATMTTCNNKQRESSRMTQLWPQFYSLWLFRCDSICRIAHVCHHVDVCRGEPGSLDPLAQGRLRDVKTTSNTADFTL